MSRRYKRLEAFNRLATGAKVIALAAAVMAVFVLAFSILLDLGTYLGRGEPMMLWQTWPAILILWTAAAIALIARRDLGEAPIEREPAMAPRQNDCQGRDAAGLRTRLQQ